MICLGIESTSDIASVALVDEDKVLGQITMNSRKGHSIILAPMVKSILEFARIKLADLDCIAVDVGPGSFTGMRIGISLASSLAYGANLPVVRVSSLGSLLAAGKSLASGFENVTVIPMIHIKRSEAYILYQGQELMTDAVSFIEELPVAGCYLIMGDGWLNFREVFMGNNLKLLRFDDEFHLGGAVSVARLGLLGLKNGSAVDSISVAPNYIRRPEAEINFEKKHGCDV